MLEWQAHAQTRPTYGLKSDPQKRLLANQSRPTIFKHLRAVRRRLNWLKNLRAESNPTNPQLADLEMNEKMVDAKRLLVLFQPAVAKKLTHHLSPPKPTNRVLPSYPTSISTTRWSASSACWCCSTRSGATPPTSHPRREAARLTPFSTAGI